MDKLLDAYSGEKALGYDARRSGSKRWRREEDAMAAMLTAMKPGTVLDCPFGTGRWVEQYEAIGATVTGIDLSQGMLDEAAKKLAVLPTARRHAYSLCCQSIFEISASSTQSPELTVCVRFLNWVDFAGVENALERLTALGSPAMIIGASVTPKNAGFLRRLWFRLSLQLINYRGRNRPKQYVHPEADLLALIAGLGWRVRDRREIMRRNARINYFYLLERS